MAEIDLCKQPFTEFLSGYPPMDGNEAAVILETELAGNKRKIIVLDDDPTGVQTVHGISVYTGWKAEDIEAGFDEGNSLFFVLTNSRGMTAAETEKVHSDIGRTIALAARKRNRDFIQWYAYSVDCHIFSCDIEPVGEFYENQDCCFGCDMFYDVGFDDSERNCGR